MTVIVILEEDVLRLTCGCVLQSGRRLREKLCFYDELKCEWDMHRAVNLAMCLGNINGHVSRHIDGFDGVHGRHGIGQRNLEGRML